ncbi:hypothetical protein VITFI_CDS0958 [Vitreoscilla filiformis]|uniref:Caspase family p20 domain-containing protein n=2 Tax=Vitreoscilla filiformis TaxID=63 RepID=A0A221KCJ3_VITFI|nr:hypothetical protein VITFI_CDS0958 [Vitreoscilla filiformis]
MDMCVMAISRFSVRRCLGWLGSGLLAVGLWGQLSVAEAARLALVIGNKDYLLSPLKNPVNDAVAMDKALRQLGFNVTLVRNLRRDDIGRTLETFTNRIQPGDDVVLFYAGHGLQVKGVNYLPAVDAVIKVEADVPLNSINLSQWLERLDESKAGVKLLLIDACRDNPYTRSFRSAQRGLAKLDAAPSGTLLHFATRPGSVAADGTGSNGLYTSYLLKHLSTPGVPVESMLKRVAADVRQSSQNDQQPWMEGALDGEFFFRPGSVTVASADPPPPTPAAPPTPTQTPAPPPAPAATAKPTASMSRVGGIQAGQTDRECIKDVCFSLVGIPAGRFQMGSPEQEAGRWEHEGPTRTVTVSGFWMGQHEVTQGLWRAVMGDGATQLMLSRCGDHCPVIGIGRGDAQEFAEALSKLTGKRYIVPSEAQWEYAARAGTTTRWSFGDEERHLGEYAWYADNSDKRLHPTGQKKPNPWGLYDVYGNAWEIVRDTWHDSYTDAPTDGSAWGASGLAVARGGSWDSVHQSTRSANRVRSLPLVMSLFTGLRIARLP